MKKIIKKIRTNFIAVSLAVLVALSFGFIFSNVSAQEENKPDPTSAYCKEPQTGKSIEEQLKNPCVSSDIEEVKRQAQAAAEANRKANCGGVDCGGIVTAYINPLIKLISVVAGIIMAISLVWAAIQYSSAGGDPNKVAEAKQRIFNTIMALILYVFSVSILEWLIPGNIIL